MNNIFVWLLAHYEEILGTIFSLIYLYFSIKQNIWLWPLGLISSLIYSYVFFNSQIYADMGLQVYYVFVSIYGWYYWSQKKIDNNTHQGPKVKHIDKKLAVYLFILTAILFVFISFVLKKFTNSEIPYWDAFTTAASITATWMLAKKYIEHWLVWIVVDFISSGIYLYKELYFTIFLYLVYTSMAIVGYLQWNKDIQQSTDRTY